MGVGFWVSGAAGWDAGVGRFGFFSFGQLGGGRGGVPARGNGVVVGGGESAEKEAGEIAEDRGEMASEARRI